MKHSKKIILLLSAIFIACMLALFASASDHIVTEAFTYENGFTSGGVYSSYCSCGSSDCENNATLQKAPLFEMLGYSTPEKSDETRGLSFSYSADVSLIEEYERINNCKITYGFLLAGANNYENNPSKVSTGEFDAHYSKIDVRINYGKPDGNGTTKYDKYDAIFAGRVTVENASGEKTTSYFQLNIPTTDYENNTLGTMSGINFDAVTGKQNQINKWQNSQSINAENGQVVSAESSYTVTENYIKVKNGDTIGISSSAGAEFMIYCYNYIGGKYEYRGYIDVNGEKYTFNQDSQASNGDKLDINDLYVRLVCKSKDNSSISYTDIENDIVFNITEEKNSVIVTFKDGDNTYNKNCYVGQSLGFTPKAENGNDVFLGWYDESSMQVIYTENTIIENSVTLVPVFRKYVTDVENYINWSQSYMLDQTGSYLASDASRYVITSFIKVNEGDSISLPTSIGHKFVIYCYSDMYGTYTANSIIDCNPSDTTSAYENWGYSYTFKNGDILENGSTLNCDNLYIRIAFKKDSGSVNIDTLKSNIEFNISADNYHLYVEKNGGEESCNHKFDEWTTLQERSCLLDGIDARDCLLCLKREVRYTQATGHKGVIIPSVAADCGTDGYTEGAYCEICNTILKEQQIISKDGLHQYYHLVSLSKAPTLTEEGLGTFKCIVCGATREEVLPKRIKTQIGTDYIKSITTDEFNVAKDNAWKVIDGKIYTPGIYSTGDDWFGNVGDKLVITFTQEIALSEIKIYTAGNWTFADVVVKNASGTELLRKEVNANGVAYGGDGAEAIVLSGGNLNAYTVEIEITSIKGDAKTFKVSEIKMTGVVADPRLPHTHQYNEFVKTIQEPTCQASGKDQYRCYCGRVSTKSTSKLSHSYEILTSTDEPTCTVNGMAVYKCVTCDNLREITLNMVGHNYSKLVSYITEPTYNADGSAIFKCIHCDKTETKTIKALELGKAEYLRVESIKNGVVTLLFNVYGESANYEIRYSTSEITNSNFANAELLNVTVIGDKEYKATFNLDASLNNGYYVAIRPYIGSNYGEISTVRVGGNKLIPIDYHNANVYSGELLNSFAKLFDEQAAEKATPTSQLPRLIGDINDTVLYNMNLSPIVDLESMHYVSSTYLYFDTQDIDIKVRWSDTPTDAYADDSKWDGVISTKSTVGWNEFKIDSDTRYIQIIFKDGSAPYEMLIYGYQNGKGDEIADEIGSLPTIGEMMGMCGFVAGGGGNTPIDSVSCTTVLREYHNFGWSYSLTAYPGKASFFNNSWMANFDSQYRDYKNAGINVIPCVQWDLVNIPQSNQVDENNLPIKSNGSFVKGSFYDKMNPHTYFMYADSMFAFSARYGTNSSAELLNTLALHVSDTNKVGLNYLNWIELGNEPEGSWNGIHNYYSAYQLAALTSAAYDGHCRTMVSTETSKGYHLGLKNADPNMKAAMAGVSAVSNEYITSLCYWMKSNRNDGKVAFDAFNVHCYMTKTITLSNGSKTTVGACPEEAGVVNTLSQLIKIRDKYYPEKEVWITEFGWDTNQSYATSTSSHAYANEKTGVSYTGREVQAMWLTRTYLLLSANGVDKATMYMCEDCGVEEESVGKYGTAGVIGYKYDENGNTVEFKKDSYYYLYTLKNTLGSYTFNKQIEAYDDNVYIYQYKTEDGKTAYAVWCGTSDGTVSNNYQLRIDSESATIVENENGNVYGKKTDVKADSLGYISVNVSEKPVYILVD